MGAIDWALECACMRVCVCVSVCVSVQMVGRRAHAHGGGNRMLWAEEVKEWAIKLFAQN